jgi:glutathione reductase (NADPH)
LALYYSACPIMVTSSNLEAVPSVAKVVVSYERTAIPPPLTDHRPFGGTCALRGCNPKKIFISGDEAIEHGPAACAAGARQAN